MPLRAGSSKIPRFLAFLGLFFRVLGFGWYVGPYNWGVGPILGIAFRAFFSWIFDGVVIVVVVVVVVIVVVVVVIVVVVVQNIRKYTEKIYR